MQFSGQRECNFQASSDCDRPLTIAACRAHSLTSPGSLLPQHCNLLMNKVSIMTMSCVIAYNGIASTVHFFEYMHGYSSL